MIHCIQLNGTKEDVNFIDSEFQIKLNNFILLFEFHIVCIDSFSLPKENPSMKIFPLSGITVEVCSNTYTVSDFFYKSLSI